MNTEQRDTAFDVLRELPPEVTLDQVGAMVAAFPLVPAAASWTRYINLDTMLMTTAGTLIIAGAIHLFNPAPTASGPVPVPIVEAEEAPADAVVLEIPAERSAPARRMEPKQAMPATPLPPKEPLFAVVLLPADTTGEVAVTPVSLDRGNDRDYDLRDFSGVHVFGSAEVMIEKGDFAVHAEGKSEALDGLVLNVVDRDLRVTFGGGGHTSCDGSSAVIVHVRMPDLQRIEVTGSGDVKAEGFGSTRTLAIGLSGSGDVFVDGFKALTELDIDLRGSGDVVGEGMRVSGTTSVDLKGSGDVRVTGHTEALSVKLVGSGDVDASDMQTTTAAIDIRGSGDVLVNAKGRIESQVLGSGEFHNTGNADEEGSRGDGIRSY